MSFLSCFFLISEGQIALFGPVCVKVRMYNIPANIRTSHTCFDGKKRQKGILHKSETSFATIHVETANQNLQWNIFNYKWVLLYINP